MFKLDNRGVTLIELIAVIILVGVICLITIPSIITSITKVRKESSEENLKRYADILEEKRLEQEYLDKENYDDDLNKLDVVYNGGKVKCDIATYTDSRGIMLNDCMLETDPYNKYCLIDGEVKTNKDCGDTVLLNVAIKNDNVIRSSSGINYLETNKHGTNYKQVTEETEEYTFNSMRLYWFSDSYTFNSSNGKYTVGTEAEELLYSSEITYKYVCGNTTVSKSCTVLYELVSLNNSSAIVIPHTSYASNYEDNGVGLFKESVNGSDTYFFRGNVNNNVKFAGYDWDIIRINEDGSIRMILDNSIGSYMFNEYYGDNAFIGYMYGEFGMESYEETHANIYDSAIKQVLDSWYEKKLLNYTQYIADSGFCGDRSLYYQNGYAPLSSKAYTDSEVIDEIVDSGLGYGDNVTFYGPLYRLHYGTPRFDCINKNDLFTVSRVNGNGSLTYPIGLITIDEVMYAGGVSGEVNDNYYLFLYENPWWTMSPYWFFSENITSVSAGIDGVSSGNVNNYMAVRPVINLKSDVTITTGNGSYSFPYIIEYDKGE